MRGHVAVIDPAMRVPELDCYNRLARHAHMPLTYHLPALHGVDSLVRDEDGLLGVVILGSGASVNDDLAWQHVLFDWLGARLRAGVPTLGLCYGHQAIAHLFGGQVGYLRPGRDKRLGLRTVHLAADPLWGQAQAVEVLVSHREHVVVLPDDLRGVGHSDEVAIEALAHRSLPVWGFQSHPEATPAFARNNDVPFAGPPARLARAQALVDAFLARFSR